MGDSWDVAHVLCPVHFVRINRDAFEHQSKQFVNIIRKTRLLLLVGSASTPSSISSRRLQARFRVACPPRS